MTVRTHFMRAALAVAATVGMAALSAPVAAETVTIRVVKHAALRVLDPIMTTAYMSRNHGYMIYDTLFALDANMEPQPQMVADWEVSEDGLEYRFRLREGLLFHDGAPVTGEDVAASIRRWGERDAMGQMLMAFVEDMYQDEEDERVFVLRLREPYALVIESLAKPSSNVPFIMPARLAANTPSTEQVPEQIGSGPFRFVEAEFQPGVIAVYERNPYYVPRDEEPSWAAGGKVVHVDRVEWIVMPDDHTTLSALLAGEIDYWESVPADLLPILQADPDIVVRKLNVLGFQTIMRPNMLQPPFDDARIRRAAILAVHQQDVMDAMIGNPDLYILCAAMFVCGSPLETDIGGRTLIDGTGQDEARRLLEEAGYDGTPVVLLHPTDVAVLRTQPVVVAQALRDVGFVVDLQAMDWMTLVARRVNQGPPAEGGWNMFITNWAAADLLNPLVNNMMIGQGREGGWFGWPEDAELEEMRRAFARAETPEERFELAKRIQAHVYEQGYYAPIGQFFVKTAWRRNIEGVLDGPAPYFWNIRRVD